MFSNSVSMVRKSLFVVICVSLLSVTSSSQAGYFDWWKNFSIKKVTKVTGKILQSPKFYVGAGISAAIFAGSCYAYKKYMNRYVVDNSPEGNQQIVEFKKDEPKDLNKSTSNVNKPTEGNQQDDENVPSTSTQNKTIDKSEEIVLEEIKYEVHKTLEHGGYTLETFLGKNKDGEVVKYRVKVSSEVLDEKEYEFKNWDEFFTRFPCMEWARPALMMGSITLSKAALVAMGTGLSIVNGVICALDSDLLESGLSASVQSNLPEFDSYVSVPR